MGCYGAKRATSNLWIQLKGYEISTQEVELLLYTETPFCNVKCVLHCGKSKMADGILKMLPKDLVLDILLRLPVKFLLRFKCLSKIWYSLIESQIFINLHLSRTSTTNDEFVLFRSSFREAPYQYKSVLSFFSIGHDDYDLHPVSPDLNIPYPSPIRSCTSETLIGPCRGLIVITDRVMAVILNPATRNYRLLQPSPFGSPLGFHRSIDGTAFGFDSIANEYKFVRLAEVRGEPPFCCDTVREWRVEVCELSTDSWREIDNVDQELPYVRSYTCAELFYKGATHWFAHANTRIILCFDMSTETFRNMKMPNSCHSRDRKCYGLVILNESLTLICYPYPGCVIDPAIDFMEIWVMKEYGVHESWSKKYRITPLAIESPLAIWKDHLLFLQSISGHLMSYDLNSDEVKEYNLLGWPQSLRVTIYKESLTLIPKGKFNNPREDQLSSLKK